MYTKISVQQSGAQVNLQDRRKNSSSVDPSDPKAIWPFCTSVCAPHWLFDSLPRSHSRMSLSLCSAINSNRQQSLSRKKGSTSARGALVTSPSWPGFEELFPGEKQHRPRRSCTSIPTVQWISHGIATTNSRVLRLFGS